MTVHAAAPSIAFPGEVRTLGRLLRRWPVDWASLARPVAPCRAGTCHGMCCHDGVTLSGEERRVILALLTRHAPLVAELYRPFGLTPPGTLVERLPVLRLGPLTLFGLWRTAQRPHPFRTLLADYPSHFGDTACVFLLPDARCALQALSQRLGHHPWHLKPVSCWLHPLKVGSAPGVSLYLPTEETDLARHDGYPGYVLWTRCGRRDPAGQPARAVFHAEIAFLAAITGVALTPPDVAACNEMSRSP